MSTLLQSYVIWLYNHVTLNHWIVPNTKRNQKSQSQCCQYLATSIHTINAPSLLLLRAKRSATSKNVSSELMRKLERSCSSNFVTLSQKWVINFGLAEYLAMRIVCLLPYIGVCVCDCAVLYGRLSSGVESVAVAAPLQSSVLLLLVPPGSQLLLCCHVTVLAAAWRQAGARGRVREEAGGWVPACLQLALPASPPWPSRPQPAALLADYIPRRQGQPQLTPAPQNFPALLPHLCPRWHTHTVSSAPPGLPKSVWTSLTLFDTCTSCFLVVKNVC